MRDLSVLIPARNEMFLKRTVDDVLAHREADTEIIVVCDGAWPVDPLDQHPRVTVVHLPEPIGQRAATNLAARLSTARYVMKLDAHCAVAPGFDRELIASAVDLGPNVTQVPVQWNLHAFDWLCAGCATRLDQGPTPAACACGGTWSRDLVWTTRRRTDSWRFDASLKFGYFGDCGKRPASAGDIADTMSCLGACWFLSRERYVQLGGLDEQHGSWGQMGTEVACKSWLSGGRLVTNKRTWFAHLFRTQGGDFGFPYPMKQADQEAARTYSRALWTRNAWPGQIRTLRSLVEQFAPVPGWTRQDLKRLPMRVPPKIGTAHELWFWQCWLERHGHQYRRARRLASVLMPMLGDQPEVSILNLGCGAVNLLGELVPGRVIHMTAADFLADAYTRLQHAVGLQPVTPLAQEDMTHLSYPNASFDIVYCANALDHCVDPRAALRECVRVCKPGGWVYLKHFAHEGKRMRYSGLHAQNLDAVANGDCRVWSPTLDFLLSEIDPRFTTTGDRVVVSTLHKPSAVTKGLVYYSDGRGDATMLAAVRTQIQAACHGYPIVSATLQPVALGQNIVLPLARGYLTMFKQILAGLDALDTDVAFLVEHDVLYDRSHFQFTPPRDDTCYYNQHVYKVDADTGRALHYRCSQTSGLCAHRQLLIDHYRRRIARVEAEGFNRRMGFEPGTRQIRHGGIDDSRAATWMSARPNIDIRHAYNLTPSRWTRADFRNQKYTEGWTEADAVPGWGVTKDRFPAFLAEVTCGR